MRLVSAGVLAVVGGFLVVVGVFFGVWLTDDRDPADIRVAIGACLSPILLIVIAQKLLPSERPAFLVTQCMVTGAVLVVPGFFIWYLLLYEPA